MTLSSWALREADDRMSAGAMLVTVVGHDTPIGSAAAAVGTSRRY
ncbi:hypothetical protein [Natrinema hispanicum]|nr:hypothetical protein [Natrinema hispanicum]